MGKGVPKITVYEYHMSLHFGLCTGPIDAFQKILIDQKVAWTGNLLAEDDLHINKPSLFGGDQKEGGAVGDVHVFFGDGTQVMPEFLAARYELTTATCPAFRHIATAFFIGNNPLFTIPIAGGGAAGFGFQWKTSTPYLPPVAFKVRRESHVLDEDSRKLSAGNTNPAHMIYECLVNEDWGMGSAGGIDDASFLAAALTLKAEDFGLSVMWTRQSSIQDFVNEILGHIQAVLFLNPRTGLQTLKLIRDDYDVSTLRVLDQNNCKITNFQRKLWGETTNEISVTWTWPNNEKTRSLSVQDNANIAIQGGTVSDSRNFYMIRDAHLAGHVAVRELRSAAAPLATFEISVDRSAWDILPGDVVKINYPEHGMFGVVARLLKINCGKPGDETIKINSIEDIFSLPYASYVDPPDTGWQDPAEDPEPMVYVRPFTIPYGLVDGLMDANAPTSPVYPEIVEALLASPGLSKDTIGYDLWGEVVQSNGSLMWQSLGFKRQVGRTLLVTDIPAEAITLLPDWTVVNGGPGPSLAGFAFIGDGVDSYMELVLFYSIAVGVWTIYRGILDTVPKAWPAGTPIWFFDFNSNLYDPRLNSDMESINYKLLTQTSRGILDFSLAPTTVALATGRPWYPNRPANVKVDGFGFGPVTLAGVGTPPAGQPLGMLLSLTWYDTITVTWAVRNRLLENTQVLAWTDSSMTPESGQTTTITLMDATRVVLQTIDGLTGTSHDVPTSVFVGLSSGIVRVTSKRDGFESLQGHEIVINF